MRALIDWPRAPALETERLSLEPLRVEHAEEMAPLLADRQLHRFTGGEPRTVAEMRERYEQQVAVWALDGSNRWVNWIVRERAGGEAVGGVQAEVTVAGEDVVAALAWIVGVRYQGHGYAREAVAAMMAWLCAQGAGGLIADIHPGNVASQGLARALGLTRSGESGEGGDDRWTGGPRPGRARQTRHTITTTPTPTGSTASGARSRRSPASP